MNLQIPFQPGASWVQEITLEGRVYRMSAAWSGVGQCWYMGLSTRDNVPIVSGVKLVQGADLLEPFADLRLPPGRLFVVGNHPSRNSFADGETELIYVTAV